MERRVLMVEKTYVPRAAVESFFRYCREATRALQDADQEPQPGEPERKRRLH